MRRRRMSLTSSFPGSWSLHDARLVEPDQRLKVFSLLAATVLASSRGPRRCPIVANASRVSAGLPARRQHPDAAPRCRTHRRPPQRRLPDPASPRSSSTRARGRPTSRNDSMVRNSRARPVTADIAANVRRYSSQGRGPVNPGTRSPDAHVRVAGQAECSPTPSWPGPTARRTLVAHCRFRRIGGVRWPGMLASTADEKRD